MIDDELVVGKTSDIVSVELVDTLEKVAIAIGDISMRASPEGQVGNAFVECCLRNVEGTIYTLVVEFFVTRKPMLLGPAAIAIRDDS